MCVEEKTMERGREGRRELSGRGERQRDRENERQVGSRAV